MTIIRSEGASISVDPYESGDHRTVMLRAYVLLGEDMSTKIGVDLDLPPAKALALADALRKCATDLQQQSELLAVEVSASPAQCQKEGA